MPLILQDDTGTATGANAYIDSSYADAYFTDRNKDESMWIDLDQEVKDAAIISATSYIDNSNIGKLRGRKLTKGQTTQFPRLGVVDFDGFLVDGLPDLLKMATAEYAIRAVVDNLAPDVTYDESGMPVKSKKEKIGPIEETTVYQDDVMTPTQIRKYPEADMLLKQYLYASNYLVRG